ncbi:MAG: DUF58 domain-containing protein [Pirellulaceae bacterium]
MSAPHGGTPWRDRLHYLLTTDFTPSANRYVYWLKTPLGVLVLTALASLLMGLFVTPQGYILLAASCGVIALGIIWPWVGLRGIHCRLRFDVRRCKEQEQVKVILEVANRWPFPVWGLAIQNGFFDALPGEDTTVVALARVPGWSRCDFPWDFTPECRGVYPTLVPRVATEFPFGMFCVSKPVEVPTPLIVWPETRRFSELACPLGPAHSGGAINPRRTGDDGDRAGVRGYRLGDSMRQIHWAQTAKFDQLIVSERQGASQSSVQVYIDMDPAAHAGIGRDSSREWAIRIGASLALDLARQNLRVTLRTNELEEFVSPAPGNQRQLMDRLATMAPETESAEHNCRRHGRDRYDWVIVIQTDRSTNVPRATRRIELATAGFDASAERFARLDSAEPRGGRVIVDGPVGVWETIARRWNQQRREVAARA